LRRGPPCHGHASRFRFSRHPRPIPRHSFSSLSRSWVCVEWSTWAVSFGSVRAVKLPARTPQRIRTFPVVPHLCQIGGPTGPRLYFQLPGYGQPHFWHHKRQSGGRANPRSVLQFARRQPKAIDMKTVSQEDRQSAASVTRAGGSGATSPRIRAKSLEL
jgi:hypothetical protein